jgi:hypothetical protein
MADPGPQVDDSTQSFVVRTWQEPPGSLRGTVQHVQSQTQHGFTRLSQAQEFIEQKSAQTEPGLASPVKSAAQPARLAGLHRRRFLLAASAVSIVIVAGLTVIASANLPLTSILGSAVGPGLSVEVIVALCIGLVLGSLGSAIWLRRGK